MRPTVSLTALAGWCGVFLSVVFAQSDGSLYKKVGDEVILKPNPGSVTGAISAIVWKDGPNIAMQWETPDPDITAYRQFKERGSLNTTNGEMTITGLLRDDSASYAVQINGRNAGKTDLRVLSPVPVPTVSKACDDEKTRCTFTCEGDTTGVDEVTYMWKSDDSAMEISSKELHIKKENDSSIKWFSCELINPVSQESSKPIDNPFPSELTCELSL
uniref:Ig-like domain-containing protein n=1 Tax=Lates calcarifer TaxID=8187 RepID=A0A4W6EZ92_LATCA